jgi:hypothetical protein
MESGVNLARALTVSTIFTYVLYGIERVDEKAEIPFCDVMKSRLFIAFLLPYAHSAITLPTTYYALTYLAHNDPVLVGSYVTGINTVGHLAMCVVLYYVLRKAVKVKIPWKSIGKYVAASLVMGMLLFSLHPVRSSTLVFTAIGGLVYLGTLVALDKDTRMSIRTVFQMIGYKIKKKEQLLNENLQ